MRCGNQNKMDKTKTDEHENTYRDDTYENNKVNKWSVAMIHHFLFSFRCSLFWCKHKEL